MEYEERVYRQDFKFSKTGWRPKSWVVNLSKPKKAILTIEAYSKGDSYARYIVLIVNGKQVFKRVASGSFKTKVDITGFVKDGSNKIELVITTYVGYWEAKLTLKVTEAKAKIPSFDIFSWINELIEKIKQGKLDEALAYSSYALSVPLALLPYAVAGGELAYKELKKRGIIK